MEASNIKDSSLVFSKGLTSYTSTNPNFPFPKTTLARPSDDARYLIRKNLKSLVENVQIQS